MFQVTIKCDFSGTYLPLSHTWVCVCVCFLCQKKTMNYNKLNWCSGWRFHYPFGFTDFDATDTHTHTECIQNRWECIVSKWTVKLQLLMVTKQNICADKSQMKERQTDRLRQIQKMQRKRERVDGFKQMWNSKKKKCHANCWNKIKLDNGTHRWIHLHSVLRLHNNNTTNFIFIANKTNFYHYLARVCSF